MRTRCLVAFLIGLSFVAGAARADDVARVRDAVKHSTLDQPGTRPFHLKAVLAPTYERDRTSGRTGEVEIWWASPTRFRREVRSPEFHQIEIVDGKDRWQKNEGDFYPEWLRVMSTELVRPVPPLDEVLRLVKVADVKRTAGSTYFSWNEMSTDGTVEKAIGATVAVTDQTGLLLYGGGVGWGAIFHDYQNFHGRMVARTVGVGSPEVTAKVVTLEDLGDVPAGFFDAHAAGGDAQLLDTVIFDELTIRKHLLRMQPVVWPTVRDGRLEGTITATVLLDREGKVRDVGPIVSDNFALNDTARNAMEAMRFTPYLVNGVPVQVRCRITMGFKTTRPPGVENFEKPQTFFERGRTLGFLAAAKASPYVLRAEFETGTANDLEKGEYEDTYASETQWRREARMGNSRYIRSRNGDKRYELSEGPSAALLKLVLRVMEPIPALDTFIESDWKIKRDSVNGIRTVRVLTGYESADGQLDPKVRAYWFDDTGQLVQTHFQDIETQRSEFEEYFCVRIARRIDVLKNGKLGMRIRVTDVSPAGLLSTKTFKLRGHDWTRAFTDEVR